MALIMASTSVGIILSCLFQSAQKKEPLAYHDVKKRPESSAYRTVAGVFMYILGTQLNQGTFSSLL